LRHLTHNAQANKKKNRYNNVTAFDHSRVKLQTPEGTPASDFINANFINGFGRPNAYIATQGPIPSTFSAFWRMMWENKSEIILMLTNLIESSMLKCHQYWPDESNGFPAQLAYGAFTVSVLSKQETRIYVRRKISIRSGSQTRTVDHFHYTVWPDHGVPETTVELVEFRHAVLRAANESVSPNPGPTVVHCSAGLSLATVLSVAFPHSTRCWKNRCLHCNRSDHEGH
jgi:protein tyrosine phosphatase